MILLKPSFISGGLNLDLLANGSFVKHWQYHQRCAPQKRSPDQINPTCNFNLFRCSAWHQYYVPREGSLQNPTHTFYFSKYSLWHQHCVPRKGSPRRVYAYLAVTCYLHFCQNDRDLLHATVVTQRWNGYQNKSPHRKLTLEKKILLPLLQGFEPETF